jgi:hypothetical protein
MPLLWDQPIETRDLLNKNNNMEIFDRGTRRRDNLPSMAMADGPEWHWVKERVDLEPYSDNDCGASRGSTTVGKERIDFFFFFLSLFFSIGLSGIDS